MDATLCLCWSYRIIAGRRPILPGAEFLLCLYDFLNLTQKKKE